MEAAFEKLLNFNEPLDCNLLDQVVEAMYLARSKEEQRSIQTFMTTFQDHPQSWTRVDTILEFSQSAKSKFFCTSNLGQLYSFPVAGAPG